MKEVADTGRTKIEWASSPQMNGPIQDADTLRASSIKFVDATNGKRLPIN